MPFTPNALLMCLVLGTGSGALSGELPERLRRADSFLGIHFGTGMVGWSVNCQN
jgi:hypothetical protein